MFFIPCMGITYGDFVSPPYKCGDCCTYWKVEFYYEGVVLCVSGNLLTFAESLRLTEELSFPPVLEVTSEYATFSLGFSLCFLL